MKETFTFFAALLFAGTLMAQIPTNGLQLHYTFDGDVNDLSGNNFNLNTTGTIFTSAGTPGDSSLTNYDGPETYFDFTDFESNFQNQNFTIYARYYPTDIEHTYSNIIEIGSSSSVHIYLRLLNRDYIQTGIYNDLITDGNNSQGYITGGLNEYNVIVVTTSYDPVTTSRNIRIYCNGTLVTSDDFTSNTLIDYNLTGTNIQLLGRSGTSTMNAVGNLDELAYYNRAMDSTEIINMSTLSLGNIEQKTSFNIFPNPASASFTLSHLPNNATIQLVDQTGRVVKTEISTLTTTIISTDEMHSGIYFVRVTGKNGETSTQKLVIE